LRSKASQSWITERRIRAVLAGRFGLRSCGSCFAPGGLVSWLSLGWRNRSS
jgi:hypothetical protein